MRVLIYCPENRLRRVGGPTGYLYQLRKGLLEIGNVPDLSIEFLPGTTKSRIKQYVPKAIDKLYTNVKLIRSLTKGHISPVDITRYDAVHFHSVDDLNSVSRQLFHYSGKVVLTTHTPCAGYLEKKETIYPFITKLYPDLLSRFEKTEADSIERADAIILPCREAEEVYFNTWPRYASLRKESKMHYMPTGTEQAVALTPRHAVREQYRIPEDAFVFSYVGRHNEIKGYDRLIGLGKRLLQDSNNIWFLVAGAQGRIKSLESERWIEAGWTDDPHSLVAASDVFILPNRETYFDLVFLEVLSLGVPLIASFSGGNRFFSQYDSPGISFFKTDRELYEVAQTHITASSSLLREMSESNKQLYSRHFTEKQFALRYIKTIQAILCER